MRLLGRLWRIPLRYALIVALPLQVLVLWTVLQGYAAYARYNDFCVKSPGSSPIALNLEQWHYFARDLFYKDLNRLRTPHFPEHDGLETFSLIVDGGSLSKLNSSLPESGKISTYPAVFEIGKETQRVKVRYMGDNQWHWLFPQKSWRIKTKSGDPFRNRRAFNLKNSPFKLTVSETMTSRLSRELGVLTPDVEPVKLMLNGAYAGLYLFWDIVDESLLRRARRMPGSLYRGEGARIGKDGVNELYKIASAWDKTGSRNAEQVANREDIDAYIVAINASPLEFYTFAERHIDMDSTSGFVAVDRAFAGQHHDYAHNHKLYFDPYKGRFEPIQWDFGVWFFWGDSASFDRNEYPILSRLKQHPEYAHVLAKRLYDLLVWYTPEEMNRRLDELVEKTRLAVAADGLRDFRDSAASSSLGMKKEPSATFSMSTYDSGVKAHKRGFARSYKEHQKDFMNNGVRASFEAGRVGRLHVDSFGHVASDLKQLRVHASQAVSLYRDSNLNGALDSGDTLVAMASPEDGIVTFDIDERLYSGLAKRRRASGYTSLYGLFELIPTSLRYLYLLSSEADVERVESCLIQNSLTRVESSVAPLPALDSEASTAYSYHPWRLPPKPADQSFTLGPGVIHVSETRRFGSETSVTIAPGTTFRIGAGASLFFHGKVTAVGTSAKPIRFEGLDAANPWGVMLLHGKGTAGSRLAHCEWVGGSIAHHDMMDRTGMISVIDTRDIVIRDSLIGENFFGDDAMHWGYVTGGVLKGCRFENARSDACDMDICEQVRIEDCEFIRSGNDSLDLMTSKITISGCRFFEAGDKGVSVGEGTFLELRDSQFIRCVKGIEIKDSSVASIDAKTVIEGCDIGINLYRKNLRYAEGGTLLGETFHIVGSKTAPITWDKRSTVPAHVSAKKRGKQ